MAEVHNQLHRATQLIRGLRRAVGMSGPTGGVERMGETLTPILNVFERAEWYHIRGEAISWGYVNVAAGAAGTVSQGQLSNPNGSGVVLVCTAVRSSVNPFFLRSLAATAFATESAFVGTRDFRRAGGVIGEVRSSNTAAAAGAIRGRVDGLEWRGAVVVAPNTSLVADSDVEALAIRLSFEWYEHRLLPGEFLG